MTLIAGIVHPRGLVIAADSEESTQIHKRSISKLVVFGCSNGSSLIVGGSGPGYLIDAAIPILQEKFVGATTEGWRSTEQELAKEVGKFYRDHVLSWPTVEERREYDFSLLFAIATTDSQGAFHHRLMVAEMGVLREVSPYYAIGMEDFRAMTLIDQYLSLRPNLLVAVIVAYVIFLVKSDTQTVGKETEIWRIESGVVSPIMQPHIEQLEKLFKRYEYAKVNHFLTIFAVSGFSATHLRHDDRVNVEIKAIRGEFRDLIERINDPAKR
jgi:hypothetical protein